MTEVDGQSFESFTTFDANGRVDKVMYPSGYTLQNRYTAWSGALDRVSDPASGAVHWLASARYPDGQIQTMSVGNQTSSKSYDGLGRVATIATGSLQNATYGFDALGNLTSRSDPSAGQSAQGFAYDRVNRLTNDGTTNVGYDTAGNIASKNGWTSCPITQNGCIRVMFHPGYPNPLPVRAVMQRLGEAAASAHHEFWADDSSLLDPRLVDRARVHGPRQVTDVYLLALAVRHKGLFATFDSAISSDAVKGAQKRHLLAI